MRKKEMHLHRNSKQHRGGPQRLGVVVVSTFFVSTLRHPSRPVSLGLTPRPACSRHHMGSEDTQSSLWARVHYSEELNWDR